MRKIFPFQKIKIWPRITCQGLKKNGTKNWRKRTRHYFQSFFAQTVSFSRTFLSFLSLVMVWRPLCHLFYQARFPRPPRLSDWKFQPVTFGVHSTQIWYLNQWKELIDWFSDQRTDVSYAYMLAGVYGITSLASSWIISPLNYWNMTDGHNFRTQACFKSQLLIGSNFCSIFKTWKALCPAIQKMPSTKRRWTTKNHDR